MQYLKELKSGIAALFLGLGALASASASAQDVIAVANGVVLHQIAQLQRRNCH